MSAGRAGVPVNLVVAGRRVVVVGGGPVAARKARPLLEAGAEVVVIAPEVGEAVQAWVDAGAVTWEARTFSPGDLDDAWLAVAATGVADADSAVADAAEARRVFLDAAGDAGRGSLALLSVLRRGDIVVAVGTNGRSPALAAWLKERLATEMGPEYETLLDLLAAARDEVRAAGRPTADADWRRAMDSGILDLIRDGRQQEAEEVLRSCL